MGLSQTKLRLWAWVGAAVFGASAAAVALAQDETPEAGEAPAAEAEAPAAPVKPRPAEIMPLAAKSMLLDVQKTNDQYIAVGDRGNIVLSADGTQWTQVNVPARSPLTAVHFPDPEHGWAVGHDATILASSDGGKTWALQNFQPDLEKPFLDVLFLSATRGFAVGAYGLFYETSDAGKTWSEVNAPAIREEELHFNAIVKLNNGELFIAGEQGMLGVSKDQGATWQRLQSPYESSLFGALPVGDKGVLIFGLRGNVFLSKDVRQGGWKELETNSVASMFGGTALPDGRLAMVGLNGVVFVADGAGKVELLKTPTGTPLSAAIPFGDGLLVVGESGVQMLASLK